MSVTSACIENYGDSTRQLGLLNTTSADYQEYCDAFIDEGYIKKVENSSALYGGAVLTSSYSKGDGYVTITHIAKRGRTYITIKTTGELSEHLSYKASYVQGNISGAKTKLHMPELYQDGSSFIIQLKNGHFIIEDGGMPADCRYLVELLEDLAPNGEKPVVEAWFITHGHNDHIGALAAFKWETGYSDRLCVEGIYFNIPSEDIRNFYMPDFDETQDGFEGMALLRTSSGKATPIYRPQTGQRYYFNDITVDILHTQEQILMEDYDNGFNDTSTWHLYTIEGQTFLSAGDTADGSVKIVKATYDKKYLDFDILATFHHGQNVTAEWVNYFTYRTILYTTFSNGSQTAGYNEAANKIMRQNASEYMCWGDGRKVLTFQYQVGTYTKIAPRTWTYHPDRVLQTPY